MIVSTPLDIQVWLNDTLLTRADVQNHIVYRLPLNCGDNQLLIKGICPWEDAYIDATLCSEEQMIREYCRWQNGVLIYPIINSADKTIVLANVHQNMVGSDVQLELYDVANQLVGSCELKKDTFAYRIPELQSGRSYICYMTMNGVRASQPVFCGTPEEIYEHFNKRYQSGETCGQAAEQLKELFNRLDGLMKHGSRHNDWWWQFKIPPLTYEIENIYAAKGKMEQINRHTAGIQMKIYISELDGGTQRYLLLTPKGKATQQPMPLVVVVRPSVVNHWPFFFSPQMSRWWSIITAQTLADTYGYAVMMVEARMYQYEELTPFAESALFGYLAVTTQK